MPRCPITANKAGAWVGVSEILEILRNELRIIRSPAPISNNRGRPGVLFEQVGFAVDSAGRETDSNHRSPVKENGESGKGRSLSKDAERYAAQRPICQRAGPGQRQ